MPLVAFYAAEAAWGLTAGIVTAMACSLGELAWRWFRHRQVDRMVLFSAGLVLVLGGLSLLSDDERFVLYGPVIGDGVFVAVLLVTLLRGQPLLVALARARDPSLADDPVRADFLTGITWRLAINLALHGAVAAWSVDQPREVWLFVSGPLQYVFIGVQVLFELAWGRLVVLPRLEAAEAAGGSPAPTSPED